MLIFDKQNRVFYEISKEFELDFVKIMGWCLRICMEKKAFTKLCIKLQSNCLCFSGCKQYTLKMINIQIASIYYFSLPNICQALGFIKPFTVKSSKLPEISLLVFW